MCMHVLMVYTVCMMNRCGLYMVLWFMYVQVRGVCVVSVFIMFLCACGINVICVACMCVFDVHVLCDLSVCGVYILCTYVILCGLYVCVNVMYLCMICRGGMHASAQVDVKGYLYEPVLSLHLYVILGHQT